ncbi:MAG TPA: hypothetical protein VLW45_00940 [Pelomicrobium sp.]|nr:hypothetical protein [Pelomicrobium sp.]
MPALAQSVSQHPWAWLAIVAIGAYHGLNPAMGWLLAVSNGMQARRGRAVLAALPPIAGGHLAAMAVALLPFTLLAAYLDRLAAVRAVAGLALIGFGIYQILSRRHPRFLARVGPSHIALWSFLMATAHGAGLMLVPVVVGLCGGDPGAAANHDALVRAAAGSVGLSLLAASVHTAAMVATGGATAWLVYRYIGLDLLGRSWFNVDLLWGVLLIVMGIGSLVAAAWTPA